MSEEKSKTIQVIEALNSAGYKIIKFDVTYGSKIKFVILPVLKKKNSSNNEIIKLIETMSSVGFNLAEFDSICVKGNIKLVMYIK